MKSNVGQAQICYTLCVQHLHGTITAAHIHVAPAGKAGPIVVPLKVPVGGTSSGCVAVKRHLAWASAQRRTFGRVQAAIGPGHSVLRVAEGSDLEQDPLRSVKACSASR